MDYHQSRSSGIRELWALVWKDMSALFRTLMRWDIGVSTASSRVGRKDGMTAIRSLRRNPLDPHPLSTVAITAMRR